MSIKVVSISILVIVGLALVYFWTRPDLIANVPPKGTNIIAFGDSLVFGTGSDAGGGFVSIVSRDLGINIINKGVPGDTTRDALARLKQDVLDNDPKVVIVLLGGNDYLKRIPKDETFRNLGSIVKEIQMTGAAVIILGVRQGLLNDRSEEDFEDLSSRLKTGYVSNVLESLIFDHKLMSDTIHPNDKGYAIIAKRVEPVLAQILNAR